VKFRGFEIRGQEIQGGFVCWTFILNRLTLAESNPNQSSGSL